MIKILRITGFFGFFFFWESTSSFSIGFLLVFSPVEAFSSFSFQKK